MQIMKFAHCLHIVFIIGKYTNIFSWGWGRIFCYEGSFQDELFRENMTDSCTKFFLFVFLSLCQLNFTCWYVLKELSMGNFQQGWNYLEDFFLWEKFSIKKIFCRRYFPGRGCIFCESYFLEGILWKTLCRCGQGF